MSISAKDVKELRDKTGAGMMDCKKALTEANGDMDKAIEILRKKGQKVSEKRADRVANQGLILSRLSDDKSKAVVMEINCETDFVARNEEFQQQAESFLDAAYENETGSVADLLKQTVGDLTIEKHLESMVGKIGEKIEINRVVFVKSDGALVDYIHPGNQLGVLVEFEGDVDAENIGKNVAMQIAAMNPLAVTSEGVDASIIDKELEIAKEQLIMKANLQKLLKKRHRENFGVFMKNEFCWSRNLLKITVYPLKSI